MNTMVGASGGRPQFRDAEDRATAGRPYVVVAAAMVSAVLFCGAAFAQAAAPVGIVSHVKVVSDKVPDISSLDAWMSSFIGPGMTDEQKAMAAWKTTVMFQHQDGPPKEFMHWEDDVHDALKLFNVYGYSYCGVAVTDVLTLSRYAGLQGRGWTIVTHCVPEIQWDGAWHLLDASLINYFPKADGKIASVQEIVDAVKEWIANNPDLKKKNDKLMEYQRQGGWAGWKKGPDLLTRCPFYGTDGWWPARTHGWYSTMQEYDGSTLFPYESTYSQGYEVNVQLRPGERLTRNWFNKGLHVNMLGGGEAPGCMNTKVGQGGLVYTPKYGDIAPGRVGNGTLEYDVPVTDPDLRFSALRYENLAAKGKDDLNEPLLHVKDPANPGILEVRMRSSYVYLSGSATFKAVVGEEGEIGIYISDNNGLDWKEVSKLPASANMSVDLKPFVGRRYDYILRFVLKGNGTGLDSLKITHDVQHSQRPLPALALGVNNITFGAAPQEGTVTVEGSTSLKNKGKQLVWSDFHPEVVNAKGDAGIMFNMPTGGTVTFPVTTPGDIVRVRFGTGYRIRDAKDTIELQLSFDGGKTFKTFDKCEGGKVFSAKYITVKEVPQGTNPGGGTRSALVRFSGTQGNTLCIFDFRIDADYKEPAGGFRPVQITYLWTENGAEKKDVHVAQKPDEKYQIKCDATPVMKSLIVELAK